MIRSVKGAKRLLDRVRSPDSNGGTISAQIFCNFLKRGVKPLTKNDFPAIFLDEGVFAEIVLVD